MLCEVHMKQLVKVLIQNIQYSRKKRKSSYTNPDVNSYLNRPVKQHPYWVLPYFQTRENRTLILKILYEN